MQQDAQYEQVFADDALPSKVSSCRLGTARRSGRSGIGARSRNDRLELSVALREGVAILRRLSVCAGDFSLEAVMAVTSEGTIQSFHGAVTSVLLLLAFGIFHLAVAAAQQFEVPPESSAPASDIDWTCYCDAVHKVAFTDQLKCMRVGTKAQLSVGGELRNRGEYFDHITLGNNSNSSGYLLQRYLLTGDLAIGEKMRFRSTLESGLENGRVGGPRPGVDEDRLFVHEAFFELRNRRRSPSIDLRLGRQDLSFGAGRIIGHRELPNVQQNFDGIRLIASSRAWHIQLLAFRPSITSPGTFDDPPNHASLVWGVYATKTHERAILDLYYFGIDRKNSTFQAGTGREQRQTLGARYAGEGHRWDHDSEAVFQFGTFAGRPIRAWTITTYTGYTLVSRRSQMSYRVAVDAGIASGNHNPNRGAFGTFNALFPKGAYFGYANFIGPYNVQIVRPSFRITSPSKRIVIWPNIAMLWRQSRQDGMYAIPAMLVQPGSPKDSLYIGLQADLNVQWQQNRHLSWSVDGEHFFAGTFLRETRGGKSVNFFAPGVTYRF